MQYVAVEGQGDPNQAGGAYQRAIQILYTISYAIKMSPRVNRQIAGFFPYVVPPLEGFWRTPGGGEIDKSAFQWIAVIRLPDFVTAEDVGWAAEEAQRKKRIDCSPAKLLRVEEGLCIQMMHLGSYHDEPASIARMDRFLTENGYENDLSPSRLHHEIYLSDPRRGQPDKRKTVLRHPIKKRS